MTSFFQADDIESTTDISFELGKPFPVEIDIGSKEAKVALCHKNIKMSKHERNDKAKSVMNLSQQNKVNVLNYSTVRRNR